MVVLEGGAVSYERDTPVHALGPAETQPSWGCIHGGRVGTMKLSHAALVVSILIENDL